MHFWTTTIITSAATNKKVSMTAKAYDKALIPNRTKDDGIMEHNWVSVIKHGNPKENDEYLVTYIDGTGGPKVTVRRWQTDRWWFDGQYTVVLAYAKLPEPYAGYRHDLESL